MNQTLRAKYGIAGLLGLFLFSTELALPQDQAGNSVEPVRKAYRTVRAGDPAPVIDGRIDEACWDRASWESGFIQRDPYEGREPSEQTSFKILYDDKSIYIGIRAHDSRPDSIEKRLSRRDNAGGDTVTIGFDSLYDRLTAFVFSVNAAGVKSDQLLVNNGQSNGDEEDMSWDPIWDTAVSSDSQGWTAEMCIPFSQLRYGVKDDQVWGLQVRRFLFRANETSDWQLIPRNAPGFVHLFGDLRGLEDLASPRQVEIMPYAVGSLLSARSVPGNPFATGHDQTLMGGLDGKIGLTSDLTMNFTVNPDFGQVEADPSVVNLTAYETFYQEKRPFFVEGRNIFDYQVMGGDGDFADDNLFYSRRIGRYPQLSPAVDGYMEMPAATTILGAFKLTGKTKSGFSIGVLNSVTARERAATFSAGAEGNAVVEPLTNYFALRAQKDWNGGATVLGAMVTAVNRERDGGAYDALHRAAYSGGIDFSHSWGNRNYYLSFKAVTSHVQGTSESILGTQISPVHYFQRPDAGYLSVDPGRMSLSGTGGSFEIGKQGGGRWMYVAGVTWRSPELELNDMGYLRQTDVLMSYLWAGYRITEPFGPFRSFNVNVNGWTGYNFGGENIFKGGNVNFNLNLKNYWFVGFGYNPQGSVLSSSALRGGPSLFWPSGDSAWLFVQTDSRKKVRFSLSGNAVHRGGRDMTSWGLTPSLTVIPGPAFNVSLSPSYSKTHTILQYVGTRAFGNETRYIFGTIDQETLALTLRLTYCLSPDLTIQYYGMPFVSAGAYRDFKRILNSRAKNDNDRYRLYGSEAVFNPTSSSYQVDENRDGVVDYSFGAPDFNFRQFRSNLVLRWEYIPGSALYVVWSQGRTGFLPTGAFDFGRDLQGLFDTHPENVFLVKFSYCFQL
ncbi:MAG: carbohydrate binding family 9 domain-containing protein [Candidatus Aminicenantes bacterium]|nr:carbohydrate binding family 9 domain-containing protein [Candidatus Aminicenantes bacterium]